MKLFGLSLETLMIRFYLLMLVVIVAGFTGLWWLAFLALPIFFSALMGMTLEKKVTIRHKQAEARQERSHQSEQATANS